MARVCGPFGRSRMTLWVSQVVDVCLSVVARAPAQAAAPRQHVAPEPPCNAATASSMCGKPPKAAWSVRTPAGGEQRARWRVQRSSVSGKGGAAAGALSCRREEVQALADDEGCGDTLEWAKPFGVRCSPSPRRQRVGTLAVVPCRLSIGENRLSERLNKGTVRSYAPTPSRARVIHPAALNREFAAADVVRG